MGRIKQGAAALGGLLGLGLVGFVGFVVVRDGARYPDWPYPAVEVSQDPAVIERGRYLVEDVVQCRDCHGDPARDADIRAGNPIPLSGGHEWNIPPGTFHAPNLTSLAVDSPKDVARALRSGVGHDGRVLLPFMEFQQVSDDDVQAIVSYLATQPKVEHDVPPHKFTLLGDVVLAFMYSSPKVSDPAPKVAPTGATAENGRYLAEDVAKCVSCHTQRDMKTGAFTGPKFGGGEKFTGPEGTFVAPNITTDPKGRLANMTEDQFVARFRAGRLIEGSPMPWPGFARMTDDDIRAVYRYVSTVPAADFDPGPTFTPPSGG